ncbi:MAG: SPFH domain-containing protein [Phycisphaerae bacterium]|nr:SPFH domain-containing protein [Phycisphaerae bacterium]
MRIDHFAYQRAVRVAGGGLLAQLALGIALLIGGTFSQSTAATIASLYVLACLPIWLGLVIVFHQHRLERLEALERDELAASRGDVSSSIFEADGARVAARRLKFMHTWLMPALSLLVATLLVSLGWWVVTWFRDMGDPTKDVGEFRVGAWPGWQLALSIALALAAFIISRFVAGMSKLEAWANLRGGAGAMVGNALVLLAIGIGLVFDFFQKPNVLEAVAYGIAIFMFAVAAEILLTFVLNLYRPRRASETPRPAFDSRVLSLFAAPDSIVRSINEAVNYQFGFDITSSWGYQLLLRSVGKLALFGLAVLVTLSMIIVVQPGQQAIKLRFGKPVGEVYQAEPMFKLPWPIETARIYDVGRVRALVLGSIPAKAKEFAPWGAEGQLDPNRTLYVVSTGARSSDPKTTAPVVEASEGGTNDFALIDADVILQYRVRDGELPKWLGFCNDARLRRGTLDMREKALRNLALREVTQEFALQPIDDLLSPRGKSLLSTLHDRIQVAFDAMQTGVDVVSVTIPRLRPPGGIEAQTFIEPSIAAQNARKLVESARAQADLAMAEIIGSPARARQTVEAVRRLRDIETGGRGDTPEATELRLSIQDIITSAPSAAAARIDSARAERWQKLSNARSKSAEVLGQAASYAVDPELYRQRKLMQTLANSLPTVRVKYILGLPPERIRVNMEMREPDAGLNIYDNLKKEEN